MTDEQPTTPKPKLRWFHLTPGRLLVILLVVEGILLLSERWFPKGWAVLIAVAAVGLFLLVMLLWFVVALLFRWRFQFSLRSLLVLTVAVAVPFSWLAMEMKWAKEQKEVMETVIKMGHIAEYEVEVDSSGQNIIEKQPSCPAWLRKVLGDDFFKNVTIIFFSGVKVTDVDLKLLNGLKQLDTLYLAEASITDAGLEHLKGLEQIGLLDLSKTRITDAALENLEGLKKLKWVDLKETKVTDAGVAKLQKALPNCKISR